MTASSLASPAASSAPMIMCEAVVRIFTAQGIEVQALQGLNLRVGAGDMVALVGASGSGKSTLLGILAGLDTPTAGSALVAGRDLVTMKAKDRLDYRRRTVGFVWQQSARNLLPHLSGYENIAMAHAVARVVPPREREAIAKDLLGMLGVADVADRRPAQLSGGQKQRIAIAVALANGPQVLLADEPTGELDERTGAEVLAAMEMMNTDRGITTLIVTHDATVAEHVARTIRIRDGRTSTETVRETALADDGTATRTAVEYAVLDRAGRLQLPAEFVGTLELRDRVQLALETDHVQVRSDQWTPPAVTPTTPLFTASEETSHDTGRSLTRAEFRALRAAAAQESGATSAESGEVGAGGEELSGGHLAELAADRPVDRDDAHPADHPDDHIDTAPRLDRTHSIGRGESASEGENE